MLQEHFITLYVEKLNESEYFTIMPTEMILLSGFALNPMFRLSKQLKPSPMNGVTPINGRGTNVPGVIHRVVEALNLAARKILTMMQIKGNIPESQQFN